MTDPVKSSGTINVWWQPMPNDECLPEESKKLGHTRPQPKDEEGYQKCVVDSKENFGKGTARFGDSPNRIGWSSSDKKKKGKSDVGNKGAALETPHFKEAKLTVMYFDKGPNGVQDDGDRHQSSRVDITVRSEPDKYYKHAVKVYSSDGKVGIVYVNDYAKRILTTNREFTYSDGHKTVYEPRLVGGLKDIKE